MLSRVRGSIGDLQQGISAAAFGQGEPSFSESKVEVALPYVRGKE